MRIDRAKTTREEVDQAIADAVRSGETLTIEHHGVPRIQIATPKPMPACACDERVVGVVCLDCDGNVDVKALLAENARLRAAVARVENELVEGGNVDELRAWVQSVMSVPSESEGTKE